MGRNKDIRDDEIRIIGAPKPLPTSKVWIRASIAIVCVIIAGVLIFAFIHIIVIIPKAKT